MDGIQRTGAALPANVNIHEPAFTTPQGFANLVIQAGQEGTAGSAAKAQLAPHVENSMEQYCKEHNCSPEQFLQALDRGAVSASDMGLHSRGSDVQLASAQTQLAQVLHGDPAFAAACGLSTQRQSP